MTTNLSLANNIKLLTERPVEAFLHKLAAAPAPLSHLVIVSPIIGPLRNVDFKLQQLVEKIERHKIITYVVTNEPSQEYPSHGEAVRILSQSRFTEIRYNASLHAKVYVCEGNGTGFAMLGSGNLTDTSITRRIEVGILINGRGNAEQLFRELYRWGSEKLRVIKESKLVKRVNIGDIRR